MSKLLTPQEVLQALQDGKKVECLIEGSKIWHNVLLFRTDVLVNTNNKFRLAQEMVTIGGVSFPKPESKKPELTTKYYMPCLNSKVLYARHFWEDNEEDQRFLRTGVLHLTRENAVAHTKALIKLSGGTIDE